MKTRRDFFKTAGLLAVAGFVPSQIFASNFTETPNLISNEGSAKNIGLQLYSLRDMVNEKGIAEVLKTVAAMGYKNLETASYSDGKVYGLAPVEFKKMVDDFGMKVTSAHLGQNYSKDKDSQVMAWWDKAIETHQALGTKYMIQPSMPVDDNSTLDYIKMYCDYFSAVGKKTKKAGIQFGYHNHSFEFKTIGKHIIFDYMLQNVDKKLVTFELDVYWCQKGGHNPVDYMKKYAPQIKVLHIKDEKEIGASGEMDFKSIFEQAYANGIEDWYVEVERYTTDKPVESVQHSFNFLNYAAYVK